MCKRVSHSTGFNKTDMTTQSRIIPFFPLPLAVLPGEVIPLHIFEGRYKQLIQDCRSQSLQFGIPFVQNEKLEHYGGLMQLERIKRVYRNETLDVEVTCTGIFELGDFRDPLPGKEYSGGEVGVIAVDPPRPSASLQALFFEYMELSPSTKVDLTEAATDFYAMARTLSLDHAVKYELIRPGNEVAKLITLENEFKLATQIKKQAALISNKFHLN